MEISEYLTVNQVAEKFGVTKTCVFLKISRGDLKSHKIHRGIKGSFHLIDPKDLENVSFTPKPRKPKECESPSQS